MYRKFRGAIAAMTAAATLFAMPAQSHAIFNWFGCNCGAKPAPLAAPVVEAPVVTPTVVNYMPQSGYRTQYVTVPMTTYRPATGCDPCTGFPVTTMRPVISYVQQARLVPYTTYRAVLTSPASPCAPVYGAAAYAPASTCSGCSAAPATQPYYSPAPASPAPIRASPLGAAPIGSASPGAPTLAPSENPPASTFTQRPPIISSGPVISNGSSAAPNGAQIETRQKPIGLPNAEEKKTSPGESNDRKSPAKEAPEKKAENEPASTSSSPRLINPGDRTTSRPDDSVRFAVHRIVAERPAAGSYSPVAWPRDAAALPAAPAAKLAPNRSPPAADDADGWRPSNR
ncbi:MAG TPA: hypothetical protein VMV10_10075 [Pirellulales bacterium]|nr:hypothetical protein [Pirellulales bacterium]